jgi:putative tricarboxylic transport membrane protein
VSRIYRLGSIVALAVSVFFVASAYQLSLGSLTEPRPGLWPFLVGLVMAASSVALFFTDDREDYQRFTGRFRFIIFGLLSLAAFIVAFAFLGFILPGFLTFVFWLRFLGEEPWGRALGLAVLFTALFYVLFVLLLGVPFPDDVVAMLWGGE